MTINTITRFLADLNGSHWITDEGPGGVDMRQRAKWAHRAINLMDARLVEAAPHMLEVLRDIIASSDADCGDSLANAIDEARNVVAKATGGDA